MVRDFSYQQGEYYNHIYRSCGDLRHQDKDAFCASCSMNSIVVAMAIEQTKLKAAMEAKRAIVERLRADHLIEEVEDAGF
jgi:hypothetical protein